MATKQTNQTSQATSISFEPVNGNENLVKAKTFRDGKIYEICVLAVDEEVFDKVVSQPLEQPLELAVVM